MNDLRLQHSHGLYGDPWVTVHTLSNVYWTTDSCAVSQGFESIRGNGICMQIMVQTGTGNAYIFGICPYALFT